jgi:hypothetical protein
MPSEGSWQFHPPDKDQNDRENYALSLNSRSCPSTYTSLQRTEVSSKQHLRLRHNRLFYLELVGPLLVCHMRQKAHRTAVTYTM